MSQTQLSTSSPGAPRGDDLSALADIEDIGPLPQQASRIWMIRLASVVFVIGAWEVLGRQVDPLFMSFPSAIAVSAARLIASGELMVALASSLHAQPVTWARRHARGNEVDQQARCTGARKWHAVH